MGLTTGDVADEAGVDYQTVLFYEREGLIEEPPRLDNGYRQYPAETVRTIQFIQRAKQLGFTLAETQRLLAMREGQETDCDEVVSFARNKRSELRKKIDQLRKIEAVLSDLIHECDQTGGYEECPIMETLVTGDGSSDSTR